jgi:hypothetical protein
MRHAVHNCAIMCVVDRTALSGRGTADEVNFDRFHSCIRKVGALVATRSKVYLSAATTILIVMLAVPAVAQVTFDGAIQGHERGIINGATQSQSTFGTVTGIVSNLGQLSLTYDDTINLVTGNGSGFGVLLIAKNGDSIFATVSGHFTLPSAGSALSVPSVKESYTVKGGTGRFSTGRLWLPKESEKTDFSATSFAQNLDLFLNFECNDRAKKNRRDHDEIVELHWEWSDWELQAKRQFIGTRFHSKHLCPPLEKSGSFTIWRSSPSARFTSRRSSSGSDFSTIKTSPTIFIISPLADKIIRAADSLIALNLNPI